MTTIGFPISAPTTPRSATANLNSFVSKSGFGILIALGIRDVVGWRVRALRSALLRVERL
jgi:hypothetical protein